MIKVFFDGACEPVNPGGTAAYGVVIFDGALKILEESKVFIPEKGKEKETSNNVAEYSGFLRALEFLVKKGKQNSDIMVFGDSKLVICQMFGDDSIGRKWMIRKGHYKPLVLKARDMLKRFKRIDGRWIPREQNDIADELSKRELKNRGVSFRIQPE